MDRLAPYRPGTRLEIDESTRRSLEISQTIRDGRREGSLLGVMDRTITALGGRMLAQWLAGPLVCPLTFSTVLWAAPRTDCTATRPLSRRFVESRRSGLEGELMQYARLVVVGPLRLVSFQYGLVSHP